MILVGNQRGGGKNLALHLMKAENERVQIHQIRGFASDDLISAFQESYAMSRATRCKQHLFSLSLNPPKDAETSPELFEKTVDRAEADLGLTGQPRAIVLHTKNGRTHAHAVWCRVDTENMRAFQLSFTKRKMQDLSRDLYREHGWKMPRGFERTEHRDPRNYSLAEWQQAKRAEKDPAKLKMMFQDTWAMSDSKAAFESALRERGFHLAQGDRRGHVAVDFKGEVYPISRWTGVKVKQVRDRLGGLEGLPSVSEAHQTAKEVVANRLVELERGQHQQAQAKAARLEKLKQEQITAQRRRREALKAEQAKRQRDEQTEREKRLRKGLLGLLDRLTGRRKTTIEENAQAANVAKQRDQAEQRHVVTAQKTTRLELAAKDAKMREEFLKVRRGLQTDIEALRNNDAPETDREAFIRKRTAAKDRRVSDLLCMSKLAHASPTKEHDDNDDFQRITRRSA